MGFRANISMFAAWPCHCIQLNVELVYRVSNAWEIRLFTNAKSANFLIVPKDAYLLSTGDTHGVDQALIDFVEKSANTHISDCTTSYFLRV